MKKLAMAAAAIVTATTPLVIATPAVGDPPHDRGRRDRDHDRGDRGDRRDRGRHLGWERGRHNGYYFDDRFFFGPPPARYLDDPRYRPGYRAWRRGERLPLYYRSRFVVIRNYGYYHLRPPPRGYHWVRDDRGSYLLVGITTGLILGLVLSSSGY